MTKFRIKYLFELYPTIHFEEEFVISQDVQEGNILYNSQATKEILPHVFDTANKTRLIQTIKKRQYEVIFILSRNIDVARLSVGTVTVVTTDGETFLAHDIEVNYEKVPGSLDYRLTLKFYRYDTDIINHLSSDNAFRYSFLRNVNRINYKVHNPSYAFNRILIHSMIDVLGYYATFEIPLNDLTSQITSLDTFYLHTNNTDYNDEVDASGDYLNFAKVSAIKTNTIEFICSNDTVSSSLSYHINNLIIDNEVSYPPIPSGVTVNDKEIEFDIYTFTKPIYKSIEINNENIKKKDEITYTDKTLSYKEILLNFWLKKDELYLKKYLNFASEIKIILADATTIIPLNKTQIIKEKENLKLIELFEFSFSAKYEYLNFLNKTVY